MSQQETTPLSLNLIRIIQKLKKKTKKKEEKSIVIEIECIVTQPFQPLTLPTLYKKTYYIATRKWLYMLKWSQSFNNKQRHFYHILLRIRIYLFARCKLVTIFMFFPSDVI